MDILDRRKRIMRKNDDLTTVSSDAGSTSKFVLLKTLAILGFISIYVCGFEFLKVIKSSFESK